MAKNDKNDKNTKSDPEQDQQAQQAQKGQTGNLSSGAAAGTDTTQQQQQPDDKGAAERRKLVEDDKRMTEEIKSAPGHDTGILPQDSALPSIPESQRPPQPEPLEPMHFDVVEDNCPVCNGTGEAQRDPDGLTHRLVVDAANNKVDYGICPRCGGSGTIQRHEQQQPEAPEGSQPDPAAASVGANVQGNTAPGNQPRSLARDTDTSTKRDRAA